MPAKPAAVPQGAHHHHSDPSRPTEASDPPKLESGLEYARARAVKETILARMAKLDLDERTEKLVSSDEVQIAAFNRFRQFRDGMLNIPDRLAPPCWPQRLSCQAGARVAGCRDSQGAIGVLQCQPLRKSTRAPPPTAPGQIRC